MGLAVCIWLILTRVGDFGATPCSPGSWVPQNLSLVGKGITRTLRPLNPQGSGTRRCTDISEFFRKWVYYYKKIPFTGL